MSEPTKEKQKWITRNWLWMIWLSVVIGVSAYYLITLFISEDKSELLIGDSTYGHYQIEMACSTCHTDAFGGKEVLQNACVNCHAEDLEAAHDSHPKKKFTDPRNIDSIEILDARYCVSCHTEHQKDKTHPMGVTVPQDYCFHCHEDIGDERESHKELAFDSCASSGCHNFHDNRALYESFLVENSGQDWLLDVATLPAPNRARTLIKANAIALKAEHIDAPTEFRSTQVENEWAHSSHASAGVNCTGCHSKPNDEIWIDKPNIEQCKSCHENEAKTFTEGKHGMRHATTVSAPLNSITPSESHLTFKNESLQKHQSCTSCHNSHSFDRKFAAVEACVGCHNDNHTLAFKQSPHGKLWFDALEKNTGTTELVSCASCHMPRMLQGRAENQIVSVNHNQNFNLRPNEKMIRTVCMNCHGLSFAINSLADPTLIENNFNGAPSVDIPSIDWAVKRENEH